MAAPTLLLNYNLLLQSLNIIVNDLSIIQLQNLQTEFKRPHNKVTDYIKCHHNTVSLTIQRPGHASVSPPQPCHNTADLTSKSSHCVKCMPCSRYT